MKQQPNMAEKFNLNTISIGTPSTWKLNAETPWVKDLLDELSENAPMETSFVGETPNLQLEIKLQKENHAQWGTILTMHCTVDATFITACVKTLAPMQDHLDVEFSAIFIDASLENDSYFEEQSETYINGKVWELYFYENNTAQIKEVIHEHIFLNLNYYPQIDEEK
jgi:hypothetical protein